MELGNAVRAAQNETEYQKQLASKFYNLWKKSAQQNKAMKCHLADKKKEMVRTEASLKYFNQSKQIEITTVH